MQQCATTNATLHSTLGFKKIFEHTMFSLPREQTWISKTCKPQIRYFLKKINEENKG